MGKLEFKIDVLKELKSKGYNTTRIRREKILSESTLTSIRKGKVPSAVLCKLCELLERQPGSIIRYVNESDGIQEKTD